MDRLVFVDTETGGLDPEKVSLLSVGAVVWDKKEGIIFMQNMFLKTEKYIITKEAFEVNHFDPDKIDKSELFTEQQIVDNFKAIKDKYFKDYKKLPLAGHNIQFDDSFLRAMVKKTDTDYESLFSYKLVDTYSVLQFLINCNKLPDSITNSTKAFNYFNIEVNGRHTAIGDAEATAKLYEKLVEMI